MTSINTRVYKFCLLILIFVLIAGNVFASPVSYCNGQRFEPCVCWQSVTKDLSYKPKDRLCKNKASIILRGKLYNIFSVVIRDKENNDRVPQFGGYNGCSKSLAMAPGAPNNCSVYKVQKKILRTVNGAKEKVNCLGASGNSSYFKNAVRITVKISDKVDPKTGKKPLGRYCLRSPTLSLN